MDIYVKWYTGSMVIHLENFMECRSISKVKKLVNIIRGSCTPECEEQIREFVEQELEQYEPRQKETAKYIVGYTEKVRFCERQLANCISSRDRFKRKSDGWEHYNSHVNAFRDELKELKAALRTYQKQYNQGVKNHEFYKKVLEIIT